MSIDNNSKNNKKEDSKVSVFINFSTVKDVSIIEEIINKSRNYGKIVKAKLYVEQDEMENYRDSILAISKLGVEPIVIILAKNVRMAIDLLDDAYDSNINAIILIHDNEDIIPALMHAKTMKRLILITPKKVSKTFFTVIDEIIEI